MFHFSSSSSEDNDRGRTRTVTLAYAEASCLDIHSGEVSSEDHSSASSSSLATPSTQESTITLFEKLEKDRDKEQFFGYHPIWRNMSLSDGIKMKTLEYLWDEKIYQLFNFMMTHLLAHTPEDPVSFLVDLVDRCISYRDEEGDPPLVFEDDHVKSVYTSLDPLDEGSITYRQYLAGMQTLGLTDFNVLPDEADPRRNVAKDVFLQEARSALIKQLNNIIGKNRRNTRMSSVFENVVEYENCSMITR